MNELEIIRTTAPIIVPFAKPLIDSVLTPSITKLSKWAKRKSTDAELLRHAMVNSLEEYIDRTYRRASVLNTLVFPNRQIAIEDVYVPLRLKMEGVDRDFPGHEFDLAFARTFQRLLISDTAGMGKSTLLKWYAMSLIRDQSAVPVLVELRNLTRDESLLDHILSQVDPLGETFSRDLLLRLIQGGAFVFLLDGYDEIAIEEQAGVTVGLKDFVSKAPNNVFLLTSRPEASLASFGDFRLVSISPLVEEQAFELIRKYDAVGGSGISARLIEEIEDELDHVSEFLENPFLVSLLYKTYVYNKSISRKKVTYYDEVFQALFKQHDLSKDAFKRRKETMLDIHDFRRVVRRLAIETTKVGKVDYTASELSNLLERARDLCPGIDFQIDAFISDLVLAVPLFFRDGTHYRWAHKSLQDYFAAEFIAFDSRKERILRRMLESESEKYFNIFDLIFELDYPLFRRVLTQHIARKYVEYCESSYQGFPALMSSVVDARRSATYGIDAICMFGHQLEDWPAFRKQVKMRRDSPSMLGSMRINAGVEINAAAWYTYASRLWDAVIYRDQSIGDFYERDYIDREPPAGITFGELYPVTDERENPLNLASAFEIVTHVLAFPRHPLRLPTEMKCQMFLKQLDQEALAQGVEDIDTF